MGPANLFFLVLATAAPLFSEAQVLEEDFMAIPSTVWINNAAFFDFDHNSIIRPIVIRFLQPQATASISLAYVAGFICAYSPSCNLFLFAVSIIQTGSRGRAMHENDSQAVVWCANRDRPVRENATLEFTLDGNLVLRDADGSYVWSSSSSGRSVAEMVINENGNLVLSDQRKATVWQSFDHPTDTMVHGQSLVEGMRLTANTSPTNWTENQFYITILPDRLNAYYAESTPPQVYFSYKTKLGGTGIHPVMATFTNGSLDIIVLQNITDSISLPEAKSTQYMRLDSDGYLRLYEWSWSRESWTVVYDILGSMGMDACSYPTACREYGICTGGQCTCPLENNSNSSYFKLVDERKPNLGCTPLTPISCEEIRHHQLLALPVISYFDNNHMAVNATSIDYCKQACLKNCSCMAILFGAGECVWMTKVFSFHAVQPDNVGYNSSAYIKVQLSPSIPATPGMPTRLSFQKLSECTEGFSTKLGEGGFGSVFEGKLGEEKVAVKRLEGARQGKKEFLAEVETIGSIEHINLVRLIGFCVEKSERLLVYEYMSRGSLDRWIYYRHNNAPLEWCTRCRIIMDIAKGLCYLHEECRRKIAHLDIKPQNILLDDNFNAKVADFGLCKLINRDQSKVVTVMRGTPGYLAPEWLTSRITEKVDVYSFGVVIMEIISGRKNIDNSQPEENVQLINILRGMAQNNQLIDLIDKRSDDMISNQEEVVQMMKLAIWCLRCKFTHVCSR